VTLSVENTGVGHAFPTYVTPRVVLSAELVDQAGEIIAGSRQERVIARDVTLGSARRRMPQREFEVPTRNSDILEEMRRT